MNLAPASLQQQAAYLQTLPAIRERCAHVFNLAQDGKLEYWDYHAEKEIEVLDYCANIVQVGKMSAVRLLSFVSLISWQIYVHQRDFGTDYASARNLSQWTRSHLTIRPFSGVSLAADPTA